MRDIGDFDIDAIRRAASRIEKYAVRTPVLASPMLDAQAGAHVFLKAEALQVTGSFKFRGALNKMLALGQDGLRNGVAAFSAGNHAAAVAAAARMVGCPAVIVVPNDAARIKVENCRWWGAEVVYYDPASEDRVEVTESIARQRGLVIIPPFDDHEVMAGAGTVGLEMGEQLREAGVVPDAVLVNCSGGGLASGVLTAMEEAFPGVDKYVVEPRGYEKMARSLASGKPCANPAVRTTIMDGISGPVVGHLPLHALRRLGTKALSVTDDQAMRAVAAAYNTLKVVLEPGGAASLAAVLSGETDLADRSVVVVGSGGNVDPAVYVQALGEGSGAL